MYILLLYKLFFTEAVDHKPKMQHGDYCFFFNRFYAMHVLIFYSTPPPPVMKTQNLTGPSGRFSSLFRQKTSSSIHDNIGPN